MLFCNRRVAPCRTVLRCKVSLCRCLVGSLRLKGTDNRGTDNRGYGTDNRGYGYGLIGSMPNGKDNRGYGADNRGSAWLTQDLDLPLAVFEELWNRTVGVIGVPEPDPSKRIIKIIRP